MSAPQSLRACCAPVSLTPERGHRPQGHRPPMARAEREREPRDIPPVLAVDDHEGAERGLGLEQRDPQRREQRKRREQVGRRRRGDECLGVRGAVGPAQEQRGQHDQDERARSTASIRAISASSAPGRGAT